MPRGVYKRKKRLTVFREAPIPFKNGKVGVTLNNLLTALESEHARHKEASDELHKQVQELLGFNS